MKLIALKNIADNMVLARNAYAREGNVLLAKGAPLKHSYTQRLQEWGVNSVYIQDNRGDKVEFDEELCEQTKDIILQLENEFLADINNELLPEPAKQMIERVIKQLLTDKNILHNLMEIAAFSENIFRHCISVNILAMIIGTFKGFNLKQLKELATGAILIDLGKIGLPNQSSGDLQQFPVEEGLEQQQHTRLGFDILQKLKGDYKNAAQIILQHHEKYDGTGFPQGLKGDRIHEYARIAAIADTFHLYRQPKGNIEGFGLHQTLKHIEKGSGSFFDPDLIRLFFQKVAPVFTVKEDVSSPGTETAAGLYGAESVHSGINHGMDNRQRIKRLQNLRRQPGKDDSDRFTVTPERCQQIRAELSQITAKTLSRISTELVQEKVLEATRKTIDELVSDSDLVTNLVTIQALGDNTFSHCISVGILSVMTGASLGYTPEQLKELGVGSFLIDLGKVELSRKYYLDSSSLGTPEHTAVMPEHTQLGFEQLWKLKRNTNAPYIALQHHERFDGSGYPSGLKGGQINEYARIVALADAYDTLINEGIDGQKLLPHEVIEYIRDYSGSQFDPQLSQVFLENVTPFLIGANVLLNTGEKAKVIRVNKELLARPVIRVMVDSAGNKLSKPVVKDLVADLTLFIASALPEDEF